KVECGIHAHEVLVVISPHSRRVEPAERRDGITQRSECEGIGNWWYSFPGARPAVELRDCSARVGREEQSRRGFRRCIREQRRTRRISLGHACVPEPPYRVAFPLHCDGKPREIQITSGARGFVLLQM